MGVVSYTKQANMVKQRYPKDTSLGIVCYVQTVFAYAAHYLEVHNILYYKFD